MKGMEREIKLAGSLSSLVAMVGALAKGGSGRRSRRTLLFKEDRCLPPPAPLSITTHESAGQMRDFHSFYRHSRQ